MSQVINILTGETKKIRCHYLSKRTDKPVSRVLTLERLNHPALTAAGVTAWAERFNNGVNRFDWIRVSIQLTDNLCYTPNCANHDLPSIEHYNDYDEVNRRNVDNFFQSIADKPAKMMTGEDWPNMAVIAAYRAAGRDQEAETLTAARDTYNARKEADKEAWSKKYAAQQYYYNSPKPKNFDDMTELERARFMMQTAQECAKEHPELDWNYVLEMAAKRLNKAEDQHRPATATDYREGNAFEDEIKEGDRVYSRHFKTMGTVVGRYWWNGDNCYRVRMDRECIGFGFDKFTVTSFWRDGITKNIDKDCREIIGNAEYYREMLLSKVWGFNGEPRTFFDMEIYAPTEKRQTWLVVSDIFSSPKEATLQEITDYLAALYQEQHKAVKKEAFGKMFIYRLYIKWKWMQQRFERIGNIDRAVDCFYHRLRLTKLYIYQPEHRIMDYADMKPIIFPHQRIK